MIKVERPGDGDFARRYDTTVHGQSSYFVWLNRSKESLTLDLKSPQGHTILHRLLAGADVFVHNLAPGAASRMGLDADALDAAHRELIVCTITGYGSTGPWADRKAYDLAVQCETGLVSITGTPEEAARVGVSVADIAAGMYAFSGILAALYTRAITGAVRAVEISLFDALAEWMSQPALYTRYGGAQPPRLGVQHATIAPYGSYTAADGKDVLLAIQNEREWVTLCEQFLERPDLIDDPRFATGSARVAHRDLLDAVITARFRELDSEQARGLLDKITIANAGVNSVHDFLDHPALAGRWHDVQIPGATAQASPPPTSLAGLRHRMDPVPAVGQHTDDILRALGHSPTEIAHLRADGVI